MSQRLIAVLALLVLPVLGACGSDDDSASDDASDSSSSGSSQAAAKPETPTRTPTDVSCTYEADGDAAKDVELPPSPVTVSGQLSGSMETSAGSLGFTLDADRTPCAVNSFVSLADQGYYDDTTCHRLTTSNIFVLQCGDPTASGRGGPGYSFADELDGTESYPAGTLAMANAGANTNGSQFFIVYEETPLPPDYVVFGSMDEAGLAAVQKVAADGSDDSFRPGDGAPLTPVEIAWIAVD